MAIVRAVDVGYGHVKFVAGRTEDTIRCEKFASLAPLASTKRLSSTERPRNTVVVEVDGVHYEIGPDAPLLQRARNVRIADDTYTQSPAYLAMLRGALCYMGLPRIDILVAGLPVQTMGHVDEVIHRLKGIHVMPDGRTVHVDKVMVLAQPVGGYYDWARRNDSSRTTLVVDPGFFTLDFVVMKGTRAQIERSGSCPGGVHDVLTTIADGISHLLGKNYRELDVIDSALMQGTDILHVAGTTVDLTPHLRRAQVRIREGVAAISAIVGAGLDLDHVRVVGGGARLFEAAVREQFRAPLTIAPEPEFANLRGFQWAGERMAQR